MGFDSDGVRFLVALRREGVDFSKTLMIGRQGMHLRSYRTLQKVFAAEGIEADAEAIMAEADGMAEPFLRILGATETESLDASDFEGATIIHDLNLPVDESLHGRFTAVIDGGSLEHVFNFPQALKNCMEMVAPGGHFLAIAPANNQFGHGFYQLSPEVFYRSLSEDNGFVVEQMLVQELARPWVEVPDAPSVRKRVLLVNSEMTQLLVRARRERVVPLFERWPQQSDYADAWEGDKWHVEAEWLHL
jgi:SAM-dependent methyltransferase